MVGFRTAALLLLLSGTSASKSDCLNETYAVGHIVAMNLAAEVLRLNHTPDAVFPLLMKTTTVLKGPNSGRYFLANYRYNVDTDPPWPADLRHHEVILSLKLCSDVPGEVTADMVGLTAWWYFNESTVSKLDERLRVYRFGPGDFEVLVPD